MHQVNAAMRAFVHSGKGQFDNYRRHDGKFGRVGVRAQIAASLAQQNAPGAYVDFDLAPTWTCMSPFSRMTTLENEAFLDGMSSDFGAMVAHLTAVFADVKRLSTLGDLPVKVVGENGEILRVTFSGCDREFVERLCNEVGVKRGVVHEDERFAIGHLAPSIALGWRDMMADPESPVSSTYSEDGYSDDFEMESGDDAIGSLVSESISDADFYFDTPSAPSSAIVVPSPQNGLATTDILDFSGLQGVHRFLSESDEYRAGLSAWNE